MKRNKRLLIFASKVFVSALLIYLSLYLIDLEEIVTIWRGLAARHILILIAIFAGTIFVGAFRSVVFFRGVGIKLGYFFYAKLYFIGYFFNNFVPSGVGCDLMRGWIAGKKTNKMKKSYSSVITERMIGLVATVFISFVFMWLVETPTKLKLIISALNLTTWIIVAIVLTPTLTAFVRKVFKFLPFHLTDKLGDLAEQVSLYRKMPKILMFGFAISFIYQLSIIFSVYAASLVIGANISFAQMCVIAPLVWTISLIPLGINAIGLREASFGGFFEMFGADFASGVTVGALFLFVSVICGLFGGVVFGIENMLDKKHSLVNLPSKDEVEENLHNIPCS